MNRVEITRIEPQDADLTVKLEVQPPLRDPNHSLRHSWSLDMLERTCIEFRAAGAWDGSVVSLGYNKVTCEVIAGRDTDAIPWGWVPTEGDPKQQVMNKTLDSLPWWRVAQVAAFLTILLAVILK